MSNKEEILINRLKEISAKGILDAEDADRKENLHRLFMYPAMMVPVTQSIILQAIKEVLPANSHAIDPYMGSGTSLMSCMEFGMDVYGQDINPFAVLLTQSKTCFYDIHELTDSLQRLEKSIAEDFSDSIDIDYYNLDKWFKKDVQIAFSKIRRAIISEHNSEYRKFFWVVMSETIRIGSNDRTSTFKLHQRSAEELARRNVDVIKEFLTLAKRSIDDLSLYSNKLADEGYLHNCSYKGKSVIKWGNTQESIETDKEFDLLVSSPPYGDNLTTVTYGQTSFLPLLWIDSKDIACPYDYVKTTSEIDRKSLGGVINKKHLQSKIEHLSEKSQSFKSFYDAIPLEEKDKYNKTVSFMSDFDESLDVICSHMKSNAYYVWTIGNRFVGGREIPNSEVLLDLMEYRGINLLYTAERNILNKKQACKNRSSRTMEKEQILIFHNI